MATFPFWSKEINEVAKSVHSSINGLSEKDAQEILQRVGHNRIQSKEKVTPLGLFFNQFKSPIVLILVFGPDLNLREHIWKAVRKKVNHNHFGSTAPGVSGTTGIQALG